MTNLYPYEKSTTGFYKLTRDDTPILIGTERDCWTYIHRHHCYSASHGLLHEGYKMEPCRAPKDHEQHH